MKKLWLILILGLFVLQPLVLGKIQGNDIITMIIYANGNSSNLTQYVQKSGDSMYGNLNMSNNQITDVGTLFVHNITGRSPIYVGSPIISGDTITATTFYGDIQGNNGTIGGVRINNGTIDNLHVTGNFSQFDGMVNASDYNLQGDGVWIIKNGLTFEFNSSQLINYLANVSTGNLTAETNARIANDSYLQNQINQLNNTKASTGTCPTGYAMQSTTSGGVTCVQLANGTTPGDELKRVDYTGANLTGSSGDMNRQVDSGLSVTMVTVDTFTLQPIWDYTTAGTVVNFLNNIWNDQRITVWGDSEFMYTNHLGSDFSGINGTTGRTYVVPGNKVMIVVDNFMLQQDVDFTYVGGTITMLNNLWDDQRITVWVI